MRKVVKTNRYGVQLVNCGTYWAISKPVNEHCNQVYHTGKREYIRGVWNKRYTLVYDICPTTGCRMITIGKEKRENFA